jgi:Gas vesicle protein
MCLLLKGFPSEQAWRVLPRTMGKDTMRTDLATGPSRGTGLADLLDRVLDKGLVIAGDIKVSLAEVELLTIRIRLLVCSIDKAKEIGLDWWRYDHHLSPGSQKPFTEVEDLQRQVRMLEKKVASLSTARVPRALFSTVRRTGNHKRRGGPDAR